MIPEGETPFELIANDGKVETFLLTADEADKLFNEAVDQAKANGLPWEEKTITLLPEKRLIDLVAKSRQGKGTEE